MIKFGEYDENPYKLQDFPFFIILGIFGGLLGSFFIYVNFEIIANNNTDVKSGSYSGSIKIN